MPDLSDMTIQQLETHALPCPFRLLTGCDCPACGLQRSWFALLKGNVMESLTFHPAGILLIGLFVLMLMRVVFNSDKLKSPVRIGLWLVLLVTLIHYSYRMITCGVCG